MIKLRKNSDDMKRMITKGQNESNQENGGKCSFSAIK